MPQIVITAVGPDRPGIVGELTGYLHEHAEDGVRRRSVPVTLKLAFTPFQIVYSLIKAVAFAFAISFVCSYEGYVTEAGAEGVGRSTARAVVFSSVTILIFDLLIAAYLAQYIQA